MTRQELEEKITIYLHDRITGNAPLDEWGIEASAIADMADGYDSNFTSTIAHLPLKMQQDLQRRWHKKKGKPNGSTTDKIS